MEGKRIYEIKRLGGKELSRNRHKSCVSIWGVWRLSAEERDCKSTSIWNYSAELVKYSLGIISGATLRRKSINEFASGLFVP